MTQAHTWFLAHEARLNGALSAIRTRNYWSPFQESPSRRFHPEGAKAGGRAAFDRRLSSPFLLEDMKSQGAPVGSEISPYTCEPLGIVYPRLDVDAQLSSMTSAMKPWARASVGDRAGICLEMLDRWHGQVFENAHATMHTAGQSFMMAFAGSGANSLDRGLEGLAVAFQAMSAVPTTARFERRFGPGEPARLSKRYRLHPRGVAIVITCASYPAWNAYPAIMANLATGNPVVVKPHPGAVLPMAIAVETGRQVLREAGFDPNLLALAVDTPTEPITKALVHHRHTAIVDFTGNPTFGAWLEANCPRAQVYTETAGTNSVVIESTDNLDGMVHAIAQSICLFSSQMCTSAQNIFVPENGFDSNRGHVSYDAFKTVLLAEIDRLVTDHGPMVCATIQSPDTLTEIAQASRLAVEHAHVLRPSEPVLNPDFPNARTASPLIVECSTQTPPDAAVFSREFFGPIAFVIGAADFDEALARATSDSARFGSIANYAYSTKAEVIEQVIDAYADSGASVGINLVRQLPINYAAAYSDFHVTGLNPAGNACLADLAFAANRFRITQSKIEESSQ